MAGPAERLSTYFERQAARMRDALSRFVPADEIDDVLAESRREFAAMAGEIPYADRPEHSMAAAILGCYGVLAVYQAVRPRGYSAHQLGRAVVETMPFPSPEAGGKPPGLAQMAEEAAQSQRSAAPGEFVFEMLGGDGHETDYGMNITSCAVCHAFSKHDAMELVPYLCATDDVVSERGDEGLRRTGTIALGAHRCDFRFKRGGEPLTLASQYPDRIRLADRLDDPRSPETDR
jgi:hypothetical protein